MLAVTFADLWFRARQFTIAVVGVGLVLALALALSGLADGFHAEVAEAVDAVGATSWVMSSSAHGRVTDVRRLPRGRGLVGGARGRGAACLGAALRPGPGGPGRR